MQRDTASCLAVVSATLARPFPSRLAWRFHLITQSRLAAIRGESVIAFGSVFFTNAITGVVQASASRSFWRHWFCASGGRYRPLTLTLAR